MKLQFLRTVKTNGWYSSRTLSSNVFLPESFINIRITKPETTLSQGRSLLQHDLPNVKIVIRKRGRIAVWRVEALLNDFEGTGLPNLGLWLLRGLHTSRCCPRLLWDYVLVQFGSSSFLEGSLKVNTRRNYTWSICVSEASCSVYTVINIHSLINTLSITLTLIWYGNSSRSN